MTTVDWLSNVVLVGLGGGIGAVIRYLLYKHLPCRGQRDFPFVTLAINIVGSFLLGILVCIFKDGHVLLFFGTGVMGGFTTFSTFGYETCQLILLGAKGKALAYCFLSVVLSLGAAFLGWYIV